MSEKVAGQSKTYWVEFRSLDTSAMWGLLLRFAKELNFKAAAFQLERLFQRKTLLACLSLALLLASAFMLSWYYERSNTYTDIVNSTLHADLEPNQQGAKGIESFVLSNLDEELGNDSDQTINSTFLINYTKIVGGIHICRRH